MHSNVISNNFVIMIKMNKAAKSFNMLSPNKN